MRLRAKPTLRTDSSLATSAELFANDGMRRVDQLLANLGYCSRREARSWVAAGRVTVRDVVIDDFGEKVDPGTMRVDGAPLDHPDELLILMNKPAGRVCSHDRQEGPTVYDLLPPRWQKRNPPVATVGRLDKDTTGCLLLTDQSELIHRLTSPRANVQKVYRATVDHPIEGNLVSIFGSGALLLDGETHPCLPAELRILNATTAEIVLTEGRYHQVKRMFAANGYEVRALHRVRFGTLETGELREGEWRELPFGTIS